MRQLSVVAFALLFSACGASEAATENAVGASVEASEIDLAARRSCEGRTDCVLVDGVLRPPEVQSEPESETESETETEPETETETEPEPEPEPVSEPVGFPHSPIPCPEEVPEGMACVLGGWFERGSDDARPDERPASMVWVDTFFMDLNEVTNEEYDACIGERVCERRMPFRRFMRPRQPAVAMSFTDAVNFCELHGKRLPTEAEWERGARGPDNTIYSTGNEDPTCEQVNFKHRRLGRGCGPDVTRPVGSNEAGHWGLFDMTGNVHEWVSDWYSDCYRGCEGECGDECFGRNPQGPCNGADRCRGRRGLRGVRGGSWYWQLERARGSARRGSGWPNRGPHRFGFRCARNLDPNVETIVDNAARMSVPEAESEAVTENDTETDS